MGDEKITPRAGDVWKCSKATIAHPSGAYGEMFNYWYMIYRPKDGMLMVTAKHDLVERVPEDIEDGRSGWELVWREGWER